MTDNDLRGEIRRHFEDIAPRYDWYKQRRSTYHEALKSLAAEVFPNPQELALLDIGCGTGNILADLRPRIGVGFDFTRGMVVAARQKFPESRFQFVQAEGERMPFADNAPFDGFLCFDTMEHFHDWRAALAEIARVAGPETRVLLSWANPAWEPILHLLEALKLKMPEGPHRWPGLDEVREELARLELGVEQQGWRLLVPAELGPVSRVLNRSFTSVPVLRRMGLIQFVVVRSTPAKES